MLLRYSLRCLNNDTIEVLLKKLEVIEHLTLLSVEKQGHGQGLQVENLIGQDDVKCQNILSKYWKIEGL